MTDITPILCPVHGSAMCPEDYMLREDGTPRAGYTHWQEAWRCGQRPSRNPWRFTPYLARAIVVLADGDPRSEDIQDVVSAARDYLAHNGSSTPDT